MCFYFPGKSPDGEALHNDGKEHDNVRNDDKEVAMHIGRDRKSQGYGEPAPESAPSKNADRIFLKASIVLQEADGQRDRYITGKQDDKDRGQAQPEKRRSEYDDADAVVKEGFAGYFYFERGRYPGVSQDAKDGNRVGRGYEGTE